MKPHYCVKRLFRSCNRVLFSICAVAGFSELRQAMERSHSDPEPHLVDTQGRAVYSGTLSRSVVSFATNARHRALNQRRKTVITKEDVCYQLRVWTLLFNWLRYSRDSFSTESSTYLKVTPMCRFS